jgi:hypothetical protein
MRADEFTETTLQPETPEQARLATLKRQRDNISQQLKSERLRQQQTKLNKQKTLLSKT